MMKKRKIFITGAGRGIGSSLVQDRLQAGHFVAAGDITSINTHDNNSDSARLIPLQFDIRDVNSCTQAIQTADTKRCFRSCMLCSQYKFDCAYIIYTS
ncbi:SDR family NAD(P)-dependent oxidoreductase [Photorhabdus cinerea]|uniref:SDR family NAD(P)-dependent oxidoreductase n=1 Tax=Photorhabdus cinerea TaxID=471575 RepID=UPI0014082FD8|nr:SDR family NAD(P)-dependent oxidoreductase [Photorhabdus cinerea]